MSSQEEFRQKIREISSGNERVIPITKRFLRSAETVLKMDWSELMNYDVSLQPLTDGRKGFTVLFRRIEKNV